jgi:hypothetical protein
LHKNNVYVPNSKELINLVLKEMHSVPYVRHLVYSETIIALRRQYFLPSMKKDFFEYIAWCMECQKVKDEEDTIHQMIEDMDIGNNNSLPSTIG